MKRKQIRLITDNGIVAAVYAVLTIVQGTLGYGQIQFRVAEILIFLSFFRKDFILGLTIGCFIANIASPMQPWDLIFGTLATLLSVTIVAFSKNLIVGVIAPSIINGIVIGIELKLASGLPLIASGFGVFIGELAVLLVGYFVFKVIGRDENFKKLIMSDR